MGCGSLSHCMSICYEAAIGPTPRATGPASFRVWGWDNVSRQDCVLRTTALRFRSVSDAIVDIAQRAPAERRRAEDCKAMIRSPA
jgi:hypothetical protein